MLFIIGIWIVLSVSIVLLVAGGNKKPTPKFKQDELRDLRKKAQKYHESKQH